MSQDKKEKAGGQNPPAEKSDKDQNSWFMSIIEDVVDEGVKVGAEGFAEMVYERLTPAQRDWLHKNRWAIKAARAARLGIKNSTVAGRGANEFVSDTIKHFEHQLDENGKTQHINPDKGDKPKDEVKTQTDAIRTGYARLHRAAAKDDEPRDNLLGAVRSLTQSEAEELYRLASAMTDEEALEFLKTPYLAIVEMIRKGPKDKPAPKVLTGLQFLQLLAIDQKRKASVDALVGTLGDEKAKRFRNTLGDKILTLEELDALLTLAPEQVIEHLKLDVKPLKQRIDEGMDRLKRTTASVNETIGADAQASGLVAWSDRLRQRTEQWANPTTKTKGENQ